MFRDYQNYEIFADGRIWSKVSKKFLKPHTMKNGYQIVCLYDNDGKQHVETLHKVIYFAVNGLWEYPKGMQLNHIDENKINNHISNLELVTPRENINFGTRTARAAKALSKANTNHPALSKRVGAYDKNGNLVMVFASINEAGRQGFSQGNICSCCNGERKSHKGYVWKYLDDEQ